jgi:hypothetical protein
MRMWALMVSLSCGATYVLPGSGRMCCVHLDTDVIGATNAVLAEAGLNPLGRI